MLGSILSMEPAWDSLSPSAPLLHLHALFLLNFFFTLGFKEIKDVNLIKYVQDLSEEKNKNSDARNQGDK